MPLTMAIPMLCREQAPPGTRGGFTAQPRDQDSAAGEDWSRAKLKLWDLAVDSAAEYPVGDRLGIIKKVLSTTGFARPLGAVCAVSIARSLALARQPLD